MTSGSTDRLDRIEALLAQVAESNAASASRLDRIEASQDRTQQQMEANSVAMAAMREEMRLADERSRERLAETTADVVEMISDLGVQIGQTRAIVDSNARAVQAWESRIEEGIAEAEEVSTGMAADTNERLSSSIANAAAIIGDLGRQQAETDQRFNVLLEEARADRREWRQHREESSQQFNTLIEESRTDRQEWRQKFDGQIAEMRADRERNTSRFQAMQEVLQSHLLEIQHLGSEIQRIWQRLAG